MKKILHIPNFYPPHIGGIEDVCHSIILSMPEYQHMVICFNDEKVTCDDFFENIRVIRCGVFKKLFSQPLSFAYFGELKKILKEFDPDIVHFHTPNPLGSVYLLSQLPHKTKFIVHWHSDIVAQKLLSKFYFPIEQNLLKRADHILITSPSYVFGSKSLSRWQYKLKVIPNTVEIRKLQIQKGDEEDIEKIRKNYNNKKIVFTFGRHIPYKGLQYLVDAEALISEDAVIVIAGQGPLTSKLKKMSSPAIHFPGRLSNKELRCYLYAADIFAFPSITRNEAFGIALAEAMYCGLPAVTFTIQNSGVNWVCPDGETGLEVENGNIQAFAKAVNMLLKDPKLRKQLGENASERVKKFFTPDAVRRDLIDIYENY